MADWSGKAIEYLDKNEVRIGFVAKQSGQKLQVVTEHGRQEKCAEKQVIHAIGELPHADRFPAFAAEFRAAVEAEVAAVDLELIWEFVREDERDYEVAELAEILFGGRGDAGARWTSQCSALLAALFADAIYFKRKVKAFQPRPAGLVEDLLTAGRRRAEKEEARERTSEFLRRVLKRKGKTALEVPEALTEAIDQVQDYLYHRLSGPSVAVQLIEEWYDESQRRDAAYRILLKTGRIGRDVDPYLALAGIDTEFTATALGCALQLEPYAAERDPDPREDVRELWTISVDDAGTREVDDAFTLELRPDGALRLGIHIADVAAFCQKNDALDREAARRALTVYLPRGSVTMFPERLSCEIASLLPEGDRPAVSLFVELDPDLNVVGTRLARTLVRVDQKLSYADVDRALAGEKSVIDPSHHAALERAHAFAVGQQEARREAGALILERNDIVLSVDDDEITLDSLDPSTPSHVWVREMMILYNRLVAEHAREHGIPIIFRSQDPPEEPLPPVPDTYDPVVAESIFRLMKPSRLTLTPLRHASLALDAYTQATSPLRRFADLVLQRQLVAHLAGREMPYEAAELMDVLQHADTVGRERSVLERKAKRAWSIAYLERYRREDQFAAILVKEDRGDAIVELEELLLRGPLETRPEGVAFGERVTVEVASIDANQQHVRFRVVESVPSG